jgi:hypothetical protein
MGDNEMTLRCIKGLLAVFMVAALLALYVSPAACESYRASKSVTRMSDGNFIIKVKITSLGKDIYTLRLIDPDGSIIEVYAPKGWCVATDGEAYLARTAANPIKAKRSVEFIIHSDLEDISFTCSVFGMFDQIGLPETI